jgi:Sulfotransferase family
MLCSHSRLSCGPETHFFQHLAFNGGWGVIHNSSEWPKCGADLLYSCVHLGRSLPDSYGLSRNELEQYLRANKPSMAAILSAVTEQYMTKAGKARWVEKTPDHLYCLQAIRDTFPHAPILRIVRDPRDVALSLAQVPWGPKTYLSGILQWKWMHDSSAAFLRSGDCTHTVRYEDLLLQPENELRKICVKIGEKYESNMLNTALSAAHVNKLREPWKEKVADAIDANRAGVWTRTITSAQNRVAEAILGERLTELGYPTQELFAKRANLYGPIGNYPGVLEELSEVHRLLHGSDVSQERDLDAYFGNPFTEKRMHRLGRFATGINYSVAFAWAKIRGRKAHWFGIDRPVNTRLRYWDADQGH